MDILDSSSETELILKSAEEADKSGAADETESFETDEVELLEGLADAEPELQLVTVSATSAADKSASGRPSACSVFESGGSAVDDIKFQAPLVIKFTDL